jgi:hypothetical protein
MAERTEQPDAPLPCTHPEAWQQYRAHLDEVVCKCGARRPARPHAAWYRPDDAIDRREPSER